MLLILNILKIRSKILDTDYIKENGMPMLLSNIQKLIELSQIYI